MVWVESKDLAPSHGGPYWFTPDDRRVVIVKGKAAQAAQCVAWEECRCAVANR